MAADGAWPLRTPHRDKLVAAIANPKAKSDIAALEEALRAYESWIAALRRFKSKGRSRINDMVRSLNEYKDTLEVDLILKKGTPFLTRQKGQLKLDNSVLEEFLIHLVHPDIIEGLDATVPYVIGPQNAFMSLAFMPTTFSGLFKRPEVVIKSKDQDFVLGANIDYSFSSAPNAANAVRGSFALAAMAAECKVNLDKTMFQEAAGTAARLKQGCPFARYSLLWNIST